MIVHHDTKTIVLGNPKTGTTTLERLFGNGRISQPFRHAKYDFFDKDPKYKGYRYFGFYREPMDRFFSTVSYIKKTYKENFFDRNNWQYEFGMKIMGLNDISEITPSTILDTIEGGKKGPVLDLFELQTEWLNDNVNLLSFYYFEEDVKYLSKLFNSSIPDAIPNMNESKEEYFPDIKKEDEIRAKAFYKKDYEFLESKGVI